jgi:hypothetical protein
VLLSPAASGSDIIAEIDGVPLKVSELAPESRRLLVSNSPSKDVSDISLRAAVTLEVKLRTTIGLLKSRHISIDAATAQKYIAERCQKYPKSGKLLKRGMDKEINDKKFQLKCAMYYFVCSIYPELKEISDREIENFYRANSRLFRRTLPGEFMVVKVNSSADGAEKTIRSVRTSLLQGQNIYSAAEAAKLTPQKADAAVLETASQFAVRKNGVTPIFKCGNDLIVAVCIKEEQKGFTPLENVDAFIAEELMSHRCGAAFDKILKYEISRKHIKYRR